MSFTCEDVTADSEVAVQGEGEEKEEGETESSSETSPSWTQSQVVFLAALVGTDTHSKIAILASLAARLRPGCLVVARSAQGVRSVLYPVSMLYSSLLPSCFLFFSFSLFFLSSTFCASCAAYLMSPPTNPTPQGRIFM